VTLPPPFSMFCNELSDSHEFKELITFSSVPPHSPCLELGPVVGGGYL
jgi:hypothetical protein